MFGRILFFTFFCVFFFRWTSCFFFWRGCKMLACSSWSSQNVLICLKNWWNGNVGDTWLFDSDFSLEQLDSIVMVLRSNFFSVLCWCCFSWWDWSGHHHFITTRSLFGLLRFPDVPMSTTQKKTNGLRLWVWAPRLPQRTQCLVCSMRRHWHGNEFRGRKQKKCNWAKGRRYGWGEVSFCS